MIVAKQKQRLPWVRVACLVLLTTIPGRTQEQPQPTVPAGELVRQAVRHEVAANEHPTNHFFRSRKQTPKGSQTKLYVETKDAMAGMLIATDDHPLSAQRQRAETNRLEWLLDNPDQLRKKKDREKADADRTFQIVKALPDAFIYEYAHVENGNTPPQTVRLTFKPNPSYSPPTRVEQSLEGMKGFLLINTASQRIERIDGTLFKDVTFGWGILGRLDKGGHFVVQQADLGDGTWDVTEMNLNIKGRILLFKEFTMVSDEVFSDFHREPDTLTFAQGVELLKTEEEKRTHATLPADAKKTPQ